MRYLLFVLFLISSAVFAAENVHVVWKKPQEVAGYKNLKTVMQYFLYEHSANTRVNHFCGVVAIYPDGEMDGNFLWREEDSMILYNGVIEEMDTDEHFDSMARAKSIDFQTHTVTRRPSNQSHHSFAGKNWFPEEIKALKDNCAKFGQQYTIAPFRPKAKWVDHRTIMRKM
jgi:hypothetical protein